MILFGFVPALELGHVRTSFREVEHCLFELIAHPTFFGLRLFVAGKADPKKSVPTTTTATTTTFRKSRDATKIAAS